MRMSDVMEWNRVIEMRKGCKIKDYGRSERLFEADNINILRSRRKNNSCLYE
jgi:hypothetical protein